MNVVGRAWGYVVPFSTWIGSNVSIVLGSLHWWLVKKKKLEDLGTMEKSWIQDLRGKVDRIPGHKDNNHSL